MCANGSLVQRVAFQAEEVTVAQASISPRGGRCPISGYWTATVVLGL